MAREMNAWQVRVNQGVNWQAVFGTVMAVRESGMQTKNMA